MRTQELGGRLGVLGADIARGITVEQPSLQADPWGPSACSFTMKRDGREQWPDLRAGAPLLIEEDGSIVWRGRIKNTPTTDGGISRQMAVTGEGAQFRLDDDAYLRNYILSDLTNFQDAKSLLAAPLSGASSFTQGGQVSAGSGVITLGLSEGTVYPAGTFIGVTLDFGPSLCAGVAINWTNTGNASPVFFYCSGNDIPDGGYLNVDGVFAFALNGTTTPLAAFNTDTFSQPRRYVNLFLNWPGGGTPGADIVVSIIPPTSFFGDASFASGGYSVLPASTVCADALNRATLLLSADQSLISPTSFAIPELTMTSPQTPRAVITAVNQYHQYRTRVRADNRFEFGPLPAFPSIDVGSDSQFNDASAGDISNVYTDVIVTYTDALGVSQADRFSQPATLTTLSGTQMSNGDFETNITGWASVDSTLSQDATQHNSGSHSLKAVAISISSDCGVASNAWAGAFVPARKYILTFAVRTAIPTGICLVTLQDANGSILVRASAGPLAANTWTPISVPFSTQTTGAVQVAAQVYDQLHTTFGFSSWFDTFVLTESAPTIVDRWGYKRTFVLDTNMTLTPAGSQEIGTVFLEGHRTTPLKGTLIVPAGAGRRSPSGQIMRGSEFIACTQELVRMNHIVDPDTGKLGRIGRIANVTYDEASGTVTLDLDSTNTDFQALLSRMQIVTGQVRSGS